MAKINERTTKLARPIRVMPSDVENALCIHRVENDYYARPDYQQNDYISWIIRAKLKATRDKRIDQMVRELKKGGVYMGMKHNVSKK